VAVTYLPQRADRAGAHIALFFVADGIGVLAFRFATGWLTAHQSRWRLCLVGLGLVLGAAALLLPPPSNLSLIASGLLGGAGAGIVLTVAFIEIASRSSVSERGSAFAFLNAALACSLLIGSIGVAPLMRSDFAAAIGIGIVAVLASGLVAARTMPATRSPLSGSRPT
jgi:hypothetical protein